jgi:hypothetical protein
MEAETVEDLLLAYPKCFVAVVYFELIYCTPAKTTGKTNLSLFLDHPDVFPPPEVLEFVKDDLTGKTDRGESGNLKQALKQCDEPSFLTYLCGKLGAI